MLDLRNQLPIYLKDFPLTIIHSFKYIMSYGLTLTFLNSLLLKIANHVLMSTQDVLQM